MSESVSMTRREFGYAVGAAGIGGFVQGNRTADDGITTLTATELALRLRSKQISAREVLTAHLARIERVNPKVNAVVTLVAERAMADAAKADERLAHGEKV